MNRDERIEVAGSACVVGPPHHGSGPRPDHSPWPPASQPIFGIEPGGDDGVAPRRTRTTTGHAEFEQRKLSLGPDASGRRRSSSNSAGTVTSGRLMMGIAQESFDTVGRRGDRWSHVTSNTSPPPGWPSTG